MSVLEGLHPQAVFRYFEALCAIPHGSGNTKMISDYCVGFAQAHGLRYVQDIHNNVVIYCPASPGYEDHPTVILQGHLDMVCEKDADCTLDLLRDGLRLTQDGNFVSAEGTTLGGDDGIAVAYALAVLDAKDLKHPPLEAVFTVDEEIGMLGATAMDMSVLHGRVMLNIDSEDEGILTAGCAGGARSTLKLPIKREPAEGTAWRIRLSGLQGGHSGVDIHKGRDNANKRMGQLLSLLPELRLCSINGGAQDNAIPRGCTAVVVSEVTDFAARFAQAERLCKEAMPNNETEALFTCEPAETSILPMTLSSTTAALSLLNELPNGIQAMSMDIDGLVQTSLNLGIVKTEDVSVQMTFSVRSSVSAEKSALTERLAALAAEYGAQYRQSGDYPAWEYQNSSRLREIMVRTFTERYGKPPIVDVIHAGLECGIFSDCLPGLDAVSFGPQMHDIHTSRERLDIASVARVWDFLIGVLEQL